MVNSEGHSLNDHSRYAGPNDNRDAALSITQNSYQYTSGWAF